MQIRSEVVPNLSVASTLLKKSQNNKVMGCSNFWNHVYFNSFISVVSVIILSFTLPDYREELDQQHLGKYGK